MPDLAAGFGIVLRTQSALNLVRISTNLNVEELALAGRMFADTAAGIAGTTDGEYFFVVVDGAETVPLYLNDAGVAADQGVEYPTMVGLDAAIHDLGMTGVTGVPMPRVVAQKLPIFIERIGPSIGVATAAYIPLTGWYFNIPGAGYAAAPTVANSECSELKGYCKVALGSTSEAAVQTIYFDPDTLTFVATTFPTLPQGSARPFIPILTVWEAGRAISPITDLRILDNRDAIPNQCDFGDDPDNAPAIFTGDTVVDVTDAALTALGFTRGVTGTRAFIGGPLVGAVKGQRVAFRVFIQRASGATWETVPVYLWDDPTPGSGNVQQLNMTMECSLSSTAAIFSVSGTVTLSEAKSFFAGIETNASVERIVTGVQHHTGAGAHPLLIRRDDFPVKAGLGLRVQSLEQLTGAPDTFELIYPEHLFLISGRSYPLYPENIFYDRGDAKAFDVRFATSKGTDRRPYIIGNREGFEIDSARCGSSAYLITRRHGSAFVDDRYYAPLTVHNGASSGTGAKSALFIGDSIMNRAIPACWARKMVALGYTPRGIGTIDNQGAVTGAPDGVLHEAREGRQWAHFTYEKTDDADPLPPGDEATYLALPAGGAAQLQFNPFIRASTGGDDPALVQNGYIFDMDFYLTRFSLPDPDIVFVALGTNDTIFEFEAPALAQVQLGFDIFLTQIRAALPSAHIAFIGHASPRSASADGRRWASTRNILWIEQMKKVRAARTGGDTKVWFLPAYAHVSQDVGFDLDAGTADSDTGVVTTAVSAVGDVHYTYGTEPATGADQAAEPMAAFSHCVLTGA